MNITIRNIIVTTLLFFLSQVAFSQEEEIVYEDTISVTEWLVEMSIEESYYTVFRNIWVKFDENGIDSNLFEDVIDTTYIGGRKSWTTVKKYNYSSLNFKRNLSCYMKNCKLSGVNLDNVAIGNLELVDCDVSSINFKECEIGSLLFRDCSGNKVSVDECRVSVGLSFTGSSIPYIFVENNNFTGYLYQGYSSRIFLDWGNYESILISGCKFSMTNTIEKDTNEVYVSIDFEYSNIKRMKLINMDLYSLNLEGTTISKAVLFDSLNITSFLRTKDLDLPEGNSNINWSIIGGGKLCYSLNDYGRNVYFGRTKAQLENTTQFTELLSIYQKMLDIYRKRGDRTSFNACYVEMRDLQTDRLHFDYTQNKTINTLFNWRMNQFLKTFCDFGTNPVKPLIISMWVILAFGFMYFFFYNEWDKVNRQFLIKQHRKMLQYFSSEQKLEDFYTDEYMADFNSYESYKQEIDETNLHVPFFIRVLGKPLYKMSLVRFKIMTWLYRSTEVLQGKWSNLTKGRKVFVGATVGSGIVVYLVFLVAIRLLNSVVLSINTFSTLGFGDIPVKGVMKYMAILEGFLGWFLLSIFSVSLISQILPA